MKRHTLADKGQVVSCKSHTHGPKCISKRSATSRHSSPYFCIPVANRFESLSVADEQPINTGDVETGMSDYIPG